MATRVIPTFLLKGIDPNKLFTAYQEGAFSKTESSSKTESIPRAKIKVAQNMTVLAPKYGENNFAPVYCVKDKNNCSVVIATSNHNDFEIFTKKESKITAYKCQHCGKEFQYTAIGYPIAYQEMTLLTDNVHRIYFIFWTEGHFHSFSCAAAYLEHKLGLSYTARESILEPSLRMLKLLYKLMHPNAKPLRAANDPDLLIANGGSLTWEEWENVQFTYTRSNRIVIIPAKVEYFRNNMLTGSET